MKKEVGLWIDHRQAVIVINLDQEETIKRIPSNLEKDVRYVGASQAGGEGEPHVDTSQDGRDRRFVNQLDRYYDEVIAVLRDATAILILGSGEAKVELQKRLEAYELSDRVVGVKAIDKLTDAQIAAEVRQHFREAQRRSDRAIHQKSK
jgi:hypothetical protein